MQTTAPPSHSKSFKAKSFKNLFVHAYFPWTPPGILLIHSTKSTPRVLMGLCVFQRTASAKTSSLTSLSLDTVHANLWNLGLSPPCWQVHRPAAGLQMAGPAGQPSHIFACICARVVLCMRHTSWNYCGQLVGIFLAGVSDSSTNHTTLYCRYNSPS